MNTQTAQLLSTIESLLNSQVKMAQAHGLETLPHISVARARTILADIRAVKADIKPPKGEPKYFGRLDKIHA